MRLIGTALLALSCTAAPATAQFSPIGATEVGKISPFAFASMAYGATDSATVPISATWNRYGPKPAWRETARIGFWRAMAYGSLGATIEYHVLDVPAPSMFYPDYWPRYGVWQAMSWRTDPALRRYLRPPIDGGAGVDMNRTEPYGVRLD